MKVDLPSKYFANASMTNSQLTRNITGSDALVRQLYYSRSDNVRQGTAVDKDAAKLVHSAMTCVVMKSGGRERRKGRKGRNVSS